MGLHQAALNGPSLNGPGCVLFVAAHAVWLRTSPHFETTLGGLKEQSSFLPSPAAGLSGRMWAFDFKLFFFLDREKQLNHFHQLGGLVFWGRILVVLVSLQNQTTDGGVPSKKFQCFLKGVDFRTMPK